jgi:hypothetical protein
MIRLISFIKRLRLSLPEQPITTGYQPVLPESELRISMPPVKPPRGASSAHKAALLDMHERYAAVKRDHAEAFRKAHCRSDLSVTFQTMKNSAWLNRAMHEAMLELLAK